MLLSVLRSISTIVREGEDRNRYAPDRPFAVFASAKYFAAGNITMRFP
jgi:hypothetical protein